jgi:hypothetical protein
MPEQWLDMSDDDFFYMLGAVAAEREKRQKAKEG